MNTPDIETERLLLRRFTENDLKALLLIYGDEEVNTYLPWFPVKSQKGMVIKQLKKDGIPYITATHDVRNTASGNVMKRLGMRYQYSYEEQWQPKDILVTFRMYQLNLNGEQKVFRKYWEESRVHFVDTQ